MEESDRLIAVSGVLFLVAVKSFELSYGLIKSGFVANCTGVERFASSLVLAFLVTGTAISSLASFWYFKRFSKQVCEDFDLV
jgi:hypothetical protein